MLFLQSALSFSANGLTLLVIILLVRDAWHALAARLIVPLFIGSIGFSLALLPPPLRLPDTLLQLAIFANASTFGFSLVFCRALLQDDFRLGRTAWGFIMGAGGVVVAANAPGFGVTLPYQPVIQAGAISFVVGVIAYIVWTTAAGYREDLVDARRKFRIAFILFVMLSSIVVLGLDIADAPDVARAAVYDMTTIAINVAIILWAARLDVEKLFGPSRQTPTNPPRHRRARAP